MDPISAALARHYTETFDRHGPTSLGVDWGRDMSRAELRYEKMLAVVRHQAKHKVSLLDVGCGYGGLFAFACRRGLQIEYTGIDVCENMIHWGSANFSHCRFVHGDIVIHSFDEVFDYVVCNGILTQKLNVPVLEMDRFAARLLRKMFAVCRHGIAFNVMTTKVNYHANNLYYRNPTELLAWCMNEITPYIRVDHAYPLYEYTMYLYHSPHVDQPNYAG
jgi:SAM-dependent methyltransferase